MRLPGFNERLLAMILTLAEHSCSYGEPGGFLRRLREEEGTWLGHVLEHVAIELQCLAGTPVSHGKTRSEGLPAGQYHVIYSFGEEAVGGAAGELALAVIRHLLPAERADHDSSPFDFAAERDALVRLAQRRSVRTVHGGLVRAAEERDIPWIRLNDRSLVQLGHGKFQRRIQATITSETRHTAVEIASDKRLTNQILSDLGLPVPRQVKVYDAEEAVAEAEALGYPVVVKPLDGNHGKGVGIGLRTAEQVRAAFEQAAYYSGTVIVETFQEGNDYRILVVSGKAVAVAQRVPGDVVGDGRSSVAELIEQVNQDSRRGVGPREGADAPGDGRPGAAPVGRGRPRSPASVLAAQARSSTCARPAISAPAAPRSTRPTSSITTIASWRNGACGPSASTSAASTTSRRTSRTATRRWAARSSRSMRRPASGCIRRQPRGRRARWPVPVIDMLFPAGIPARIPIAAITGTNGKTTTTRMVGHILKLSGRPGGMATRDGGYISTAC